MTQSYSLRAPEAESGEPERETYTPDLPAGVKVVTESANREVENYLFLSLEDARGRYATLLSLGWRPES
jgi:hypothetical protein